MCQLEIILCTITHDFNAAVGGILILRGRTYSYVNENVLQWTIYYNGKYVVIYMYLIAHQTMYVSVNRDMDRASGKATTRPFSIAFILLLSFLSEVVFGIEQHDH